MSSGRSWFRIERTSVRRDVARLLLGGVWWVVAAVCAVPSWSQERPATRDEVTFFEQRVRPVLVQYCDECHGAAAKPPKGGLRLDSKVGWQRGGDSGRPAIVPGDPAGSLFIQAIRHEGGLEMPPERQLPANVVADLVRWVQSGAYDPRAEATSGPAGEPRRADRSWWSLQPLRTQSPVEVPLSAGFQTEPALAGWGNSPLDRFVLAKLLERGLRPNPPAEPRELIRRLSYGVIGLPPSAEEVAAFAAEYSRDPERATAALVDRLLASPHYGEHWGRHWLDVVRFGESNGFERNVIIDDLWPFRDYVIRAFNDDRPFAQVILEHLAGDVLGKDDPQVEVAAAFLVAGPYDDVGNQDAVAQAQIRAATLDDVITATSGAFLGLTVNCSRCHHHKFDPIPMEDYYRMRAAFEGVKHGRRVVASAAERAQHAAAIEPGKQEAQAVADQLAALRSDLEKRARPLLEKQPPSRPRVALDWIEETFAPVSARQVRLVMHAHTGNPRSAVGARLTEFEVWTAGDAPRNVALATAGARATGAKSAQAEDFPEAYGPQFTLDGVYSEQWFIGAPAELTVTLPREEVIARVGFANSRGPGQPREGIQGETPCEYDIQVSTDGQTWRTVASSTSRTAWTPGHEVERFYRRLRSQHSPRPGRSETPPLSAEESALLQDLARRGELEQREREAQRKLAEIPRLRELWVGTPEQPREPTYLHLGGDPQKRGAAIPPASLQMLTDGPPAYSLPGDAPEGERRLALARWITDPANALTWRVLANRVWHYHFGTGIVDTPSDFGFLRGTPTHPELLDWLASRLREHGWRLKPLHREIVLSMTYRQAATSRPDGVAVDREARWLWRFPSRRLSAEEIRDTFLVVAGQLHSRAGGPGFRLYKFTQNNVCTYFPLDKHGPETYRRAVYHQNVRASVVDLLSDFDLPDNAFAAPTRAHTVSPLQALTMLNHSFTVDMARSLAARAGGPGVADPAAAVRRVYQMAFQREPNAAELEGAVALVREQGLEALCRAVLNLNELVYLP